MTKIRAKTAIKLASPSGISIDIELPRGTPLVGAICDLISLSSIDVEQARAAINKALDEKEATK